MKDFDLRKYLSNNPLHQSNIGGFSINELQQTPLSDFEIGLAILNEIGYDFSEELLTEIKVKDLLSKAGSAIKGSLESLAFNKSSSKDSKKDFSKKLALLKKLSPSEEVYNKFIKLLKSDKKATVSDLTKLVSSSSKKQIDEKWLSNMPGGVRKTMEWIALGIYLLGFAQNLNYTPKEIDLSNQTATTISVGDDYQPILGDVGDIVDDNAEEDIKDIADEDIDDEVVNSFDTESNYLMSDVDDGGFEFWMGNGIGDIDDADIDKAIDKAIKDLKSKSPNLKKITLTDNATWTDTQGDDASDDKATDGGSVSKDRQDTSNKINKLLKKAIEDNFEDAEVTHVEKDAVKDSSKEFEAGSLEAKQAQKVGSTWSDIQDGEADTDDVSPDDTSDTDDTETNIIPPQDIIAFYSQKPDFDSNKYMVIAFQFLPRIIGNGKIVNNPAFERFAKHLTIAKSGETFNDAFVSRRIDGTEGSLVKKAAKAKGKEKEEILDTIDTLRWIRNIKKSPSNLSKGIKALDPNIKLGERGVSKFRFEKGKTPKAGQAASGRQKGSDNKGKSGLMERLEKLIPSTLQLIEITKAPGFNQDSAKENLGLLTHLFSGIWSGKDDSFIEFDNEYLEDKYKSSVDDFYTKFPSIGEKIKIKVKEKEEEKVDTKTTTPTTSKTTDVKVGDTIELDPKTSDKDTDSTSSKNDLEKTSKLGKDLDTIKKAISNKSKKDIESDKEKSTTQSDYQKGDEPLSSDSISAGEELGKQRDLATALNLINTQEELQNLLAGMLAFISPTLLNNPQKLKTSLMTAATTAFDKGGVPDSKRIKKEKSQGLKENLKSSILLSLLLEKVENEIFKDVIKVIDIINKKPSLKNRLLKINQTDELIDFILSELLEKLNDIFAEKDVNIIQALKGVATIAGAGTIKPYNSKEQVKEALTPDEATKVNSKYKEIYSGMLRDNPLKLKKYDNPDAVAYGRAIKLIQKESKLKEVYSEKQRKWACAQDDPKFDEMCKDTAISKKKTMENTRLQELIKSALMGPMNENRYDINDPNSPMGKLNDEYESSGLKGIVDKYGLDVVLMMLSSGEYGDRLNETSTDKYDDNPALKGKQSDLPDGLQKAIIKKSKGKVDEYDSAPPNDNVFFRGKTKAGDNLNLPKNTSIDNAKEIEKIDKTTLQIQKVVSIMSDAYMALGKELQGTTNPKVARYMSAMAEQIKDLKRMLKGMTNESFDSLAKDLDKQKGVDKEYAGKIAGKIANIKRKGGGKGPTAKQKKRMAETILKELRG